RKKQYNYYRDQLLTFEEGQVEWKTLSEVFTLKNGYTPSKNKPEYWTDGDIPWFRMEDLRTNGNILSDAIQNAHKNGIKGKLFPANSIIMSTTATIGEHALVTVDYLSNQRFTNFTVKSDFCESLDIKFVFYYFFILAEKAKQSINTSSFPSVQMSELKRMGFPIPSLAEQSRIVTILDKFDALTHSISEGLPREIKLRQQQYEYYRDLLLSFPKSETTV
ncbi:restriction endonuclease subunit S, partial [Bathymodiolus platifrons methanotrophic gill symbiont]